MDKLHHLITLLRLAVSAGQRAYALQLAQQIRQRLMSNAAEESAIERQVQELMRQLDEPLAAVIGWRADNLDLAQPLSPGSQSYTSYRGNRGIPSGMDDTAKAESALESPPSGSAPAKGIVYPVWFGTNRKPSETGGFSGERSAQISRGRVEVFVPESHRFGETGSSLWEKIKRFDLRDDRLRVQRLITLAEAAFFAEIRQATNTDRAEGANSHALFFLHGFNVSFEQAAIRAAQIGVDLNISGATAFFSWPSRGSVMAYPADEATIQASEAAITDFLLEFTQQCGAEKVHLIAHSMGNRGLLRVLQRIAARAETRGKVKFGQIFLAAPDIDSDLFLDLARLFPEYAERTTLYASDSDKAVHLSAQLHAAPRAGYYKPYTVAPGIDTIAVPDFDIDLLGHSYFAQAEALLHDIFDLIEHNKPPNRRQRIKAAQESGVSFWRLQR